MPESGEILDIVVPLTAVVVVFFNLLRENGFKDIELSAWAVGDVGESDEEAVSLEGLFDVGDGNVFAGFTPSSGSALFPFTLISLKGDSIGPSCFESSVVFSL